jgi:ribosomal protein L19
MHADITIKAVNRVSGVPRSVIVDIKGTEIKFIMYDDKIKEITRLRNSKVYDAHNYYISKADYAQAVKQAVTILKGD